MAKKPLRFRENSLETLRAFLIDARQGDGFQLDKGVARIEPDDWKLIDQGAANMSKQRQFVSVWDAIEDTPRKAASLRARSELLMVLQKWVKIENKTQTEAARILGVTQPRMSDLARGRIHLFSLDVLMEMAMIAGLSPHIAFKRPKVPKKRAPAEARVA